jgi:hypothetical protein
MLACSTIASFGLPTVQLGGYSALDLAPYAAAGQPPVTGEPRGGHIHPDQGIKPGVPLPDGTRGYPSLGASCSSDHLDPVPDDRIAQVEPLTQSSRRATLDASGSASFIAPIGDRGFGVAWPPDVPDTPFCLRTASSGRRVVPRPLARS